jgi:hypothetical protein
MEYTPILEERTPNKLEAVFLAIQQDGALPVIHIVEHSDNGPRLLRFNRVRTQDDFFYEEEV